MVAAYPDDGNKDFKYNIDTNWYGQYIPKKKSYKNKDCTYFEDVMENFAQNHDIVPDIFNKKCFAFMPTMLEYIAK